MFQDWPYINNYFKPYEFDSPDMAGSGEFNMDHEFMLMLWDARVKSEELANFFKTKIVYSINSGYRTSAYNSTLKNAAKDSEHINGSAVDIRCNSNIERGLILLGLAKAGFTRFGLGKGFIHVDRTKSTRKSKISIWFYSKNNFVLKVLGFAFKNEVEDL